jgi:hypothetical protein
MGVVIEICVKHPGGPTRITVTEVLQYEDFYAGHVLVYVSIYQHIYIYIYTYIYMYINISAPLSLKAR